MARCATCGEANPAGKRFCGDCGAALEATAAADRVAPPVSPFADRAPVAERRLVSVLFADLVGFTAASEGRDAEDTRELLSRYFETCQRLVSLYGGTIEKFIGDAVMAVWGAPAANEDDAERAVRTALDLVAAIPELDGSLAARAGVLTGEAAVTIGAAGQGMVAGDLVNTSSRIQAIAEPGTVLVGGATKRATEAAIAYESAGEHELKGKEQPVAVFRALHVTAARRGAQKSAGLEPPFVGHERELRLIKELFHASAEETKAHLVSLIGIGGIGSRGSRGNSRSTSTGSLTTSGGTAAGAWPTATVSLTGRWPRWCGCAPESSRTKHPSPRSRSSTLRSRSTCPTRGSVSGSSRGSRTFWRWPSARRPIARTSSRRGGCSSSAWPTRGRSCWSSRTCSGRTPACSTSSSTCSSGRAATRSSSWRWRGQS